jgi:hypothetical protein
MEGLPWRFMSVIPALRRLRQEDLEFQASLNYIGRSYLKKTNQPNKNSKKRKKKKTNDIEDPSLV